MTHFNRKPRHHRPSNADRYKAKIDRYYQLMSQGLQDQPNKASEAPARSPAEPEPIKPGYGDLDVDSLKA